MPPRLAPLLSLSLSLLLAARCSSSSSATAAPSVFWTSDPTRPGDAVSVSGAGFVAGCVANVTSASGSGAAYSLAPEPGTLFDAALVFTLPAEAPLDAWQLVIACPGGLASAPWWLSSRRRGRAKDSER